MLLTAKIQLLNNHLSMILSTNYQRKEFSTRKFTHGLLDDGLSIAMMFSIIQNTISTLLITILALICCKILNN